MKNIDDGRRERIRAKLEKMAEDMKEEPYWTWLQGRPENAPAELDLKTASKFFLGGILDYQWKSHLVQASVKKFVETTLGDPANIWEEINRFSLDEWNKRPSVHRLRQAHTRVWKIGARLLEGYSGDPREIWKGEDAKGLLARLENLGVGRQLSRMITGALIDTGYVHGTVDVKADTTVCRVLGRLFLGRPADEDVATKIARRIMPAPDNPWVIDRPLHVLGKWHCTHFEPACGRCPLSGDCQWFVNLQKPDLEVI